MTRDDAGGARDLEPSAGAGRRGDGRGAGARRVLAEHQGAARLLVRALRRDGRLVAQAAHIPVHLGSMPLSVRGGARAAARSPTARRRSSTIRYAGGTHLPDITLVAAGVRRRRRAARLRRQPRASRRRRRHARRVDAGRRARARRRAARGGGAAGGDVAALRDGAERRSRRARSPSTTKGCASRRRGSTTRSSTSCARWRVRPTSGAAISAAQRAALEVGCRRLQALAATYGAETLAARAQALIDYSEALLRAAIRDIPDGVYAFADSLDDDGAGTQRRRHPRARDGRAAIAPSSISATATRKCRAR